MGRIATTIFNPSLGIKYIVEDNEGNEFIGRTLGVKDTTHYPIRSGKGTEKGKEFFKMLINDKVYIFLNSIKCNQCLSEDGNYKFTGRRPNGKNLVRTGNKKPEVNYNELEYISGELDKLLDSLNYVEI
jgi:hypothetical protein